ncbi:Recombination protein RecR [Enhygromyxa salina]|uniref:Recombination protein RecR n=1 Tax=Enhygromyxa salina TaxID=215803 RepID=A0A0C2CR03_9BACT|nr:Recombination protein RecR [Enhygromyxa salina]
MSAVSGSSGGGDPLRRLTKLLARLPGIGEKSALRLALAIVRSDDEYSRALSEAIADVHEQLRLCSACCDLTAQELCSICLDPRRDPQLICVVAQPQDRMALERASVFAGRYHILHGVLDPLGGIGPSELKVAELLARLEGMSSLPDNQRIREVIVATSPNVEGDATALYISKLLHPLGINVSRIASGVAVGGELEYADMTTLHRALEDRRVI